MSRGSFFMSALGAAFGSVLAGGAVCVAAGASFFAWAKAAGAIAAPTVKARAVSRASGRVMESSFGLVGGVIMWSAPAGFNLPRRRGVPGAEPATTFVNDLPAGARRWIDPRRATAWRRWY